MATEVVHKVTLSTGKVVLLRDMKIKHQKLAGQALGNRFADAPLAQNVAMQEELLKVLLVTIDGEEFKSHEHVDDLLTLQEYNQCLKAITQICGSDALPQIEVCSSGAK